MAYTAADEFGDLKREKSEEDGVKVYNERVHKVILAWKNLHGLFENIQTDNAVRPLIDPGKPIISSAASDQSEPDFKPEKQEGEAIRKTTQVKKEISERKDKERDVATGKNKIQASALGARGGEEVPAKVFNGGTRQVKIEKKRDEEKDIRSAVDEKKQMVAKMKELSAMDLDRDKSEGPGEELKKTAQVIREISERKVKERAAAKVKIIGALASELGDEVRMLKDLLHQVKLEKKQLDEKNLQKDKYIRSLVEERKQLLSRISKLSEELNALSVDHHFRTAEAHHRAGTQASTSRITNKNTTSTKQPHQSQ